MEEIDIVFHTRGGIGEPQQLALQRLDDDPTVNLTVVVEREQGRQADTLVGEFVRLWGRFGA